MKLTAENVNIVFRHCLFNENENTENAIMVNGIMNNYGFHPERINNNKENIITMLQELSDDFKVGAGEGTSFINLPFTRDKAQWGEQQNAEQLMLLGMAIEKVRYTMPKEFWANLPGSMPYITVAV